MSTAKRFYKTAQATPERGVTLDARNLRTPSGALFIAPTVALAEAVAAEWAAQGEDLVPATMPLTQLAFSAIDLTPNNREPIELYLAKFAETDLLCHRADSPQELVARQSGAWGPLLDWMRLTHAVELPVVAGIVAAEIAPATLAAVRAHAANLDDFRLTAAAQAAGLAGSVVIALALLDGRLTAQAAFEAAALDNLWSLERWGEDAEARAKLDRQRAEFENLARFIATLS